MPQYAKLANYSIVLLCLVSVYLMNLLQVSIQVALLSEGSGAQIACERPFSSVHSQMHLHVVIPRGGFATQITDELPKLFVTCRC